MEFAKKLLFWAVLAALAFYGWQAWQNRPVAPPLDGDNFDGWQIVDGAVLDVKYEKFGGGRSSEMTLKYQYIVGDRVYEFESFHRYSDENAGQFLLKKYPKGAPVPVHYDPKYPKRSYVIRPNSIGTYS